MKKTILFLLAIAATAIQAQAQRTEIALTDWEFSKAHENAGFTIMDAPLPWPVVKVPHDWAITGPFDKEIDKQTVAIEQNGEKEATEKTGRSGSLPWIGRACYRTTFALPKDTERALLSFDGAMSEPEVFVNEQKVGEWKYGYTPFIVDISSAIHTDGTENTVVVWLQNQEESSRWYPGAGLFRPVRLIATPKAALAEWGIDVQTLSIDAENGTATIRISAETTGTETLTLPKIALSSTAGAGFSTVIPLENGAATADISLTGVTFWSPETPQCYPLEVSLLDGSKEVDRKTVKFGVRTIETSAEKGFALNGKSRKIKGVCLHHDLGMLGAAINKAALARQLKLLKDMGCDAIRTSHNHPSQWQMELCDSLGLMVMAESFDMWRYPKVKNGYARFYDEWWQRDLENLVKSNRLHPSIVMWSIGNEIPEQWSKDGAAMAKAMVDFVHSIDATRPVTAGADRVDGAVESGFCSALDVPGFNYRTQKYIPLFPKLSQGFLLGSETASTVSSRGVYKFPVEERKSFAYSDGQCSGYDVEACWWSNIPEDDWVLQDDQPWVIGEFVWTGFDYLGEPTPYDEYWPSRSSYFGIFDLAGLPKDRFYLYRSRWNPSAETIHLLPHWTWPGREGEVTPVYCYTNYPTAELFVNGKSQGKISKNAASRMDRYRLRWNDVVYEPGEIRVVVYDENDTKRGEQTVRTAGEPHHLVLSADQRSLKADGQDMAFITVTAVDKDGNVCPDAANRVNVAVKGAADFKGICNGDATSLEVFTEPTMQLFHGQLVVGVIAKEKAGAATVKISSEGLKSATVKLAVVK